MGVGGWLELNEKKLDAITYTINLVFLFLVTFYGIEVKGKAGKTSIWRLYAEMLVRFNEKSEIIQCFFF